MIPKFRAYDSGSLCHMYDPSEVMVGDLCTWILDEDSWGNEWIINNDLVLMQSVGLTDSAKKEIFEGDILKVTDEHSWLEVVSFSEEKAMFVSKEIRRDTDIPESPLYDLFNTDIFKIEIIGNIWENPELLEVKQCLGNTQTLD